MSSMRTMSIPVVAILVVGSLLGTSCGGGSGSEPGASASAVEAGLRQIPVGVYDAAQGESVQIVVGDMAAASTFLGLEQPAAEREADDVSKWLRAMTTEVTDDEVRLAVPFETDPDLATAGVEDVKAELGVDLGAVDAFASLAAPPVGFTVLIGDLMLSDRLDDAGGAVRTAGSGDDLEQDLAALTPVRQLGRPLRLAERDGSVAMSWTTPPIEDWVEGGETLADDERFSEVARALDDAGSVGAYIVESDFSAVPAPDAAPAISNDFGVVGIGMAIVDGNAADAIVYRFADEEAAADSVDGIEELWRDADSFLTGRPVSDLVDVDSVTQDGVTVTVIATPADGLNTLTPVRMLQQSEVVFGHA